MSTDWGYETMFHIPSLYIFALLIVFFFFHYLVLHEAEGIVGVEFTEIYIHLSSYDSTLKY